MTEVAGQSEEEQAASQRFNFEATAFRGPPTRSCRRVFLVRSCPFSTPFAWRLQRFLARALETRRELPQRFQDPLRPSLSPLRCSRERDGLTPERRLDSRRPQRTAQGVERRIASHSNKEANRKAREGASISHRRNPGPRPRPLSPKGPSGPKGPFRAEGALSGARGDPRVCGEAADVVCAALGGYNRKHYLFFGPGGAGASDSVGKSTLVARAWV